MENNHSFNASEKLYKTKFKEWKWQKNLSVETARFMSQKAKRRKREEKKDTSFLYGGRLWDMDRVENTLVRAKKPRIAERVDDDLSIQDAPTPDGVSYKTPAKTPKALVETPVIDSDVQGSEVEILNDNSEVEILDDDSEVEILNDNSEVEILNDNSEVEILDDDSEVEILDDDSEVDSGDREETIPLNGRNLSLTWEGHSRNDLDNMWQTALAARNANNIGEAEKILLLALPGLEHVLGKTNQDTVKVAYNLADIYATSGRMEEAIDLVERVIQNHLEMYNYEDKRTQQNVLQAVELLNGWNRQADALGLLSLSQELLQSSSYTRDTRARTSRHRPTKKGKERQRPTMDIPQDNISSLIQSVNQDLSPARAEYVLGVASKHIAAKDQATEALLQAMIRQCEGDENLLIQLLKAQAQLLKLYDKIGQAHERASEIGQALASLEDAWDAYVWEEDKIENFDFMEVALQLIANVLKLGYWHEARFLFRDAADKATDVFGHDDERTVWVLITIGIVYQTHLTWDDASEWFEEAFSAALANKDWGPKDGIVRSLQNAMDHQHFSYVSDEGRPFKTIFGVSGIKIMPGRLHLE